MFNYTPHKTKKINVFLSIYQKDGQKLNCWCAILFPQLWGCEYYLLITTKLVHQGVQKALFICVVYTNGYYWTCAKVPKATISVEACYDWVLQMKQLLSSITREWYFHQLEAKRKITSTKQWSSTGMEIILLQSILNFWLFLCFKKVWPKWLLRKFVWEI